MKWLKIQKVLKVLTDLLLIGRANKWWNQKNDPK